MNKLIVAAAGFLTALVLVTGYHMIAHPPGNVLAQDADTLPEAPAFYSYEVTDEGIELTWNSDSDSTETEYVLYRRVLPYERLSEYATFPRSGNQMSFTDTNVEPGLQYLYRVAGVNSAGEGPKSDPERVTVPGERLEVPPDLAGRYTEQGIELTWGAPTNAAVTDYQVYRGKFRADGEGLDGAVSKYTKVRADSDPMTYLDTNVDQGAKYRYRVAGVNATGEGFKTTWLDIQATISEPDSVPGKPQRLKGISTEQGIALTWSPPPDSIVTEYQVYRGTFLDDGDNLAGGDGAMSKYATVPADSDPKTYLDANVDPGVGYRYRVKAVNDAGEGGISLWLDIFVNSPATGAPAIAGAAQVGRTLTADTSGIADANGLDDATFSYQWLRGDQPIADATESTYTLAEDDLDRTVQVRVSFTDDHGFEETLTSEPTAAVAPPNRAATGRPTINGALVVGQTLTADTSGIADEDALENAVPSYRWSRNDGTADTHIADAGEVSYTLVSDDEGKTIKVKVSFTDDEGNQESLTSDPTGKVVWDAPPEEVLFHREEVTGEGIELIWTSNSDSTETEYVLYRRVLPHEKLSEYATVLRSGNSTSFTDTKVEPGLQYLYRVTGVNSAGEGPKSSPVTLIMPGERLEAPADLAAVYTEQGMEVTWSAPANAGITDYQVYRGIFRADGEGLDGAVSKYVKIPADGDPMTYLDTNVEEGAKYRYRVAAVNATGEGFKTTWLDVPATISETEVTTAATGAPTISGIVRVGETLTADVAGISDGDGLVNAVFSYRWSRNDGTTDTHIADAAGVSYTLVSEDEGKTIKVEVRFTDDAGNQESLTSEPTEAVGAMNQLATGQPVIVGIVRVGETLTADTSGIADADGLGSVLNFSYQWLRRDGTTDTEIADATGSSYTLADADQDGTLKVRVSFIDNLGYLETRTSDPTGTVAPANRPATGAPVLLGSPLVGETLEVDTSRIADEDGMIGSVFKYEWYRGLYVPQLDMHSVVQIESATESSYTLTADDLHLQIRVRVKFRDDRRHGEKLPTEWTETVAWPNRPATGAPAISGAARAGEVLFADISGIHDDDGLDRASIRYQWLRDDEPIAGATQSGYRLTVDDEGQEIRVRVSFTDRRGDATTLTSEPTTVQGQPNSSASGAPTISGTLQVGETLTVDVAGIADADGLTNAVFSYQWMADDANIQGATDPTYTLIEDDEGMAIKVTVSFTDDANNEESLPSAATAAVAAALPTEPLNLTVATGNQIQELDASWQIPASDGGSPVTGYRVQWKEATGSWDTPADVSQETVTGTTYTITGLTGGLEYAVRVVAVNQVGEGPASAEKTAVPRETRAPEVVTSRVDGATLRVVYDEALDEGSAPPADAFDVRVVCWCDDTTWQDEEARRAVDGVLVKDDTVILTLASPATADDYVVVSYNPPSDEASPRVQDVAGNAASAIKPTQIFNDTEAAKETAEDPPNNPATGAPTISGTAQVGEALTADKSGIADEDGLDNATFSYQWIAGGTDIDGATGSSYTLTSSEEGQAILVRVSFTDDADNEETLTSAATSAVAPRPPLTVSLVFPVARHHGASNVFAFDIRFSEEFPLSYETLKFHAFSVTGGSILKAQRMDKPSNILWRITVRPGSNEDVTVVLPATTDCDGQGAICTEDGRKLYSRLELTVFGPPDG